MTNEPELSEIVAGSQSPIWIRTAVVGDVDKLCAYYGTLSRDSRYNRFMGAVSNFSKLAFDCLMQLRRAECFTLVAEWREHGCDAIIAEACYAFDCGKSCGEFAISVADRWQRQGLGSVLLSAVQLRAVSLGYLDLFGETLKTNEDMQRLACKAGFAVTRAGLARGALRQAPDRLTRQHHGRPPGPRRGGGSDAALPGELLSEYLARSAEFLWKILQLRQAVAHR